MDQTYVSEILAAASKRPAMTHDEFRAFVTPDVRAGYAAEAKEAERRYFGKRT